RHAFEAVSSTKAILLRDTGDGKRLARKAGDENVVIRDVLGLDLRDVAARLLAKPMLVGFRRVLVPLRGENAPAARALEADSETANSSEQIDERKWCAFRNRLRALCNVIEECRLRPAFAGLFQHPNHELLLAHLPRLPL